MFCKIGLHKYLVIKKFHQEMIIPRRQIPRWKIEDGRVVGVYPARTRDKEVVRVYECFLCKKRKIKFLISRKDIKEEVVHELSEYIAQHKRRSLFNRSL